ncbi:hypothetical protein QTJ16_002356 [Diplocarpon rosae]|uniref:F-box domain-containing protein n=1 Tax=Diplocarpon rosae TaxID=946125 RepID=A0AAD9T3R0_9HELO|nr:hypothetical protein QTJ16_002356 [Diplocarpon rosae]
MSTNNNLQVDKKSLKLPYPPILPNELWAQIFSLLNLKDIQAVRLTWRQWTDIASYYLFKPMFVFRRNRKDIEIFENVMNNPGMVAGISALRFETGQMGIFCIASRLGELYSLETNLLETMEGANSRSAEGIVASVGARMVAASVDSRWNIQVHDAGQDFKDSSRLAKILQSITALKKIHITRTSTCWIDDNLLHAWAVGTQNYYFKKSNEELISLFKVIEDKNQSLEEFKHDQIPVTFFSLPRIGVLMQPLSNLRTLHIIFGATQTPMKVFWIGLGSVLCSMQALEDLRFGFSYTDIGLELTHTGVWNCSHDVSCWYVPLWMIFGSHTWSHLKKLKLEGMVFCEKGLAEFLERHAANIRELDLSGIALWQGSFEGLFRRLRNSLRLDSCHIWGLLRALQTHNEDWYILPSKPVFYSEREFWPPRYAAYMEDCFHGFLPSLNHCRREGLGKMLQEFLISDGPWPMTDKDTLAPYLGQRSFRRPGSYTTEELKQRWSSDVALEKGNRDWDRGWGVDGDISPFTHKEVLENYTDRRQYDCFGFNKAGYDDNGTHHTNAVVSQWPNLDNPLHEATARRRILKLIKDQIPRLYDVEIGE